MGLLIGCAMVPVVGLLVLMLVMLFVFYPLSTSVAVAMLVLPVAFLVRAAHLDRRDRRDGRAR